MAQLLFQETQRFRQVWIWAILVGVTGISIGTLLFVPSEASSSWSDKAIPVVLLLLVHVLFFSMNLRTRSDNHSISFRFFPFIRWREYSFDDIDALELIQYNGLLDYGGWGIKWNGESWCYTTGGKWGLRVRTKGKYFLLGTHQPEQVQKVLERFSAYKSSKSASS
ncbi:MAG: hypothetical protein RL407_1317 [Bacteroidota bacterium]|jgi:hypothetical protein|nr:hypothetical protein [Cyclobacteriaceae bacterium]